MKLAWLVAAAACGTPAAPGAPRAVVADAGVDAAIDAPPPDPAMAEVLVHLEAQRDAQCACADRACSEEVEALGFDWGFAHKDLLAAAKPTPAQDAAARAAIEAAEACAEQWHPH